MRRLLAFLHRLCPLCALARVLPRSWIARLVRRLEKRCPFCRAAGEREGAVRSWKTALRLNPGDPDLRRMLGEHP